MSNSRTAQSALLVLGSCVSLQFGAAVATPLMARFGPGLTVGCRLLFAGLLLLAIHRTRVNGWTAQQWRAALLFGISLAGMNGFFFASIARIPLGMAVTIEFAGPLMLAAVLSRRLRHLACVIAAACAIVVLGVSGGGTSADQVDIRGVIYALVAAAFWAFYILAAKHVGTRIEGQGALPVGMLIGAAVTLPLGIHALPALAHAPEQLLWFGAVAVMSSAIPYTLELAAIRHLSTQTFGILLSLEPAVAAIAGWALLEQRLSWVDAAAIATVITASVVATVERKPAAAPEHPIEVTAS